jgi:hypothetical protein
VGCDHRGPAIQVGLRPGHHSTISFVGPRLTMPIFHGTSSTGTAS